MDDSANARESEDAGPLAAIAYGSAPSILLFGDDPGRRARIADAIEAAGGRLSAALQLDEALDRIEAHAAPDGVIVDMDASRPHLAEAIFEAMETGARTRRFRSVAIIEPDLIDLAAARAMHGDIQLLCGGNGVDLATALGELVAPRGVLLSDVSADAGPLKLRELSEQVGRIARTLAALSGPTAPERGLFQGNRSNEDLSDLIIDAQALRSIIRARRMRDQFFDSEIFADPAWDMLLDLMAARIEGQAVAVSSLCIAASVPPTTALRWIKTMTDLGLFIRVADPNDRRRVFIELSPQAVDAMIGYLGSVRRVFLAPL